MDDRRALARALCQAPDATGLRGRAARGRAHLHGNGGLGHDDGVRPGRARLGALVMNRVATRLKAIIFDWAGTTVDHGSRAPVRVFVEILKRSGVAITEAEARGPMG